MLKRILLMLILLSVVALSAFTVFAQDDEDTGNTDPFQLTATQLIVDATNTAVAGQADAQAISTQSANEADAFQLTATSIVADATAAAQSNFESGVYTREGDETASPMEQTMIVFGLLIFVLVGLGGGYVLFASRNQDEKRKLG